MGPSPARRVRTSPLRGEAKIGSLRGRQGDRSLELREATRRWVPAFVTVCPVLEAIIADAETRAEAARDNAAHLRTLARSAPPARGFAARLGAAGNSVVAEIKRRSPSRGPLAPGLDAAAQARRYENGGAAAISVLTEPDHFDGSLDDLIEVVAVTDLPVLRKDFLFDPAQVWESRAAGADAVLLIVAVLGPQLLASMIETAGEAALDALVEVHDESEAEMALTAGARLIGVNNRDLATFAVDLGVSERLSGTVKQPGVIAVAESGVSDPVAAGRMWALGYDAILVGEVLVTASDPEDVLSRLVTP